MIRKFDTTSRRALKYPKEELLWMRKRRFRRRCWDQRTTRSISISYLQTLVISFSLGVLSIHCFMQANNLKPFTSGYETDSMVITMSALR